MPGKKVSRNAQQLLSALDRKFVVTTGEAMEMLNISEATARRLFRTMSANGVALRTFGGICRIQEAVSDYSYDALALLNSEAKSSIARAACELCVNGDVIYIDSGTTLALFAEAVAEKIAAGELSEITVYTNSFSTMNALAGKCSIHLVGGRWRENRRDFCGYLSEDAVRKLTFTSCFLGADACEERGLTTTDFETARLNEIVCASSKNKYVLADAGKFSRSSFVPFADLDSITTIITDKSLSEDKLNEFKGYGANIVIK